jgi:hypothetical protein
MMPLVIVMALFTIEEFIYILPFSRNWKTFVALYVIAYAFIATASLLTRLVNKLFRRNTPSTLSKGKP